MSRLQFIAGLFLVFGALIATPTPAEAQINDCGSVTGIPASECAFLLDFYNSMNGPNWDNTYSAADWFASEANACVWHSILCNSGSIQQLEIGDRVTNISGTLPTDWTGLTTLDRLVLSNGGIGGDIASISWPAILFDMQIVDTQLAGDLSAATLPASITELRLRNNSISGDIAGVTFPSNLTVLTLADTPIGGNIDGAVFPVTLQELNIWGTNVAGDIAGIDLPENLLYLSVEGDISGDLTQMTLPNTLQVLSLSSSPIIGDIASFNIPPLLQSLDLIATDVTGDLAGLDISSELTQIGLAETDPVGEST